ncbi:unnamed protein product [Auanema sp. JU1783]|nr:unnamed protein product [Auanema sp. JU1783]
MDRLFNWLKRRGDHNIVSYSRFGLPGEEQDDKPPPTTVHVAPFDEDSRDFLAFGTHCQRAAVISVGIGKSLTIFIVLSFFFEFDWYSHNKGVDVSALIGLLLFLIGGLAIHWGVIKGIKMCDSKLLVPFIVVYITIIVVESCLFIFIINHWLALNYLNQLRRQEPESFTAACILYMVLLLVHGSMLYSVTRCRNYLDRKNVHNLEMRLVERIKQQYPGINVVYGAGDPVVPNIGVATTTVDETDTVHESRENANNLSAPQRTILRAEDELI